MYGIHTVIGDHVILASSTDSCGLIFNFLSYSFNALMFLPI